MLRQAVRGARWYQHVARTPSAPSLLRRTFSAVAPRSLQYGGPNDKVRFYEQDTRDSKKRRRVDPEAEDNVDKKHVESELARLETELEDLKEGPFGPNSEFIRSLPEKERAIALEALRKYDAEHGETDTNIGLEEVFDDKLDKMLKDEFEGLAMEEESWQSSGRDEESEEPPQQPYEVTVASPEGQSYVDKFNETLKYMANDLPNERLRHDLWKWYRRCKQVVPEFLESIPEEAMALLWQAQTEDSANPSRAAHVQMLAEDAMSVGKSLPTPHLLSYIESLHENGKTKEALDHWEAHQAELSQTKDNLEAYWKLGVRLFAAEGDPQRAQDIALAFLANDKSRQPRILLPVIAAWGLQPGKEAEVKAWAMYLQLKSFLGNTLTMEDYDDVSIGLLKAGRPNLAIAVFKDMMLTGRDPANDSTSLYKAAIGLVGNLQASSISEQDVNKVSLSTLTVLPRKFQNRFFYASWMKKLIGMGEVDSAALVIELMYERGVRPDSKHLNGVIAAWLREGSHGAREKAERLGWSMVQQRIDNVYARTNSGNASPKLAIEPGSARIPAWMQRDISPANIETFSILLLHYTRRSDDDKIQYLVKCLADAQIKPNSYFMNHLLYAELRRQNVGSVWNKFQTMSATIQPDLETFSCLWDCGKLQYDISRTASVEGFPSARALFGEMVQWYARLPGRSRSAAQEEFSKEFYDQIIRCFCLSKDLPGTLVALHWMRTTFGLSPDDTTARLIVLQIARMAGVPADTPKRRLRRLSTTPRSKENIAHVHRLIEILSERKMSALQERGLTLDTLEPHEREQYQLDIMSDLLRITLRRTGAGPSEADDRIAVATGEMNVSDLDLGTSLDDDL
ncbi:hypothetical protein BDV25DRAFT_165314 [Aspergillus avenaceus]|uniref:Pentatricopeptide repeat protein n=1 Tax=Aspergillus avenaceus TaxID=36643 RepID=A0A5N6TFQ0_ASPAV|nr:hypothetical protein BDV25DRAFT_165314 [Aspergillus avenaceus]